MDVNIFNKSFYVSLLVIMSSLLYNTELNTNITLIFLNIHKFFFSSRPPQIHGSTWDLTVSPEFSNNNPGSVREISRILWRIPLRRVLIELLLGKLAIEQVATVIYL
jgi:hypothetical protein